MDENKVWKTNIKDWTIIEKEMADLMVRECELALSGSIDSCESVISRSDKLIAIYIPICTGLIVYLLSKINDYKKFSFVLNDTVYLSALMCLLVSITGLIFCFFNAKSYIIRGSGSDPKKIVSTNYIDNGFDSKLKYINLSLAICENANLRMEINNKKAYEKSKYNNISAYLLFAFPVCPILAYLFHLMFACP